MGLLQNRSSAVMAKHSILLLALAAIAQAATTTTQNTNTNTNANTDTAKGTTAAATIAAAATGTTSLSDLPNLSTAATVGASTVSVTSAPDITSSSATVFHLSDVPTIAGYGIPTMVVPWTAGAPYMQSSKFPEGTVFIIVGAFLGTLGVGILLWRAVIAWTLHRSVKKASLGVHHNDSMLKLTKQNPANPSTFGGSTLSVDRLSYAPAGKLSKAMPSGPNNPATNARNSSLFFSPTAGAGAHHPTPGSASGGNNRASAYLPAGYYAAPGAATPASGAQMTSVGGAAAALSSLNPMHPSNKGYRPQYDVSPPDSPGLAPSIAPSKPSTDRMRRGHNSGAGYERVSGYGAQNAEYQASQMSNLSLPGGAPNGGRAPSANLEDLFEHHGNGMSGRY